jgi:hypothetical protein
MNGCLVTGHFDTNVIQTLNQTTAIGNFLNWITVGLIPTTITGTTTVQTQTKGIGLLIENSTNSIYKDISASGLVMGISTMYFNTNNIFARIDLPMTNVMSGGKFGGIYLNPDSVNNTLCEVSGNIFDDCNQLLASSTCTQKNNYYYDSCFNVFNQSGYGQTQSMPNILLTPLYPQISSAYYPFLSFLTTPFFLAMMIISGVSGYVAFKTKAEYGVFTMIVLVMITSMISFTTFFFGFIFVIILSYVLIRYYTRSGESAT